MVPHGRNERVAPAFTSHQTMKCYVVAPPPVTGSVVREVTYVFLNNHARFTATEEFVGIDSLIQNELLSA